MTKSRIYPIENYLKEFSKTITDDHNNLIKYAIQMKNNIRSIRKEIQENVIIIDTFASQNDTLQTIEEADPDLDKSNILVGQEDLRS